MKSTPIILISFILFAILLSGCDSALFDQRISEGVIEYEITYPNLSDDNYMASMMPDKMITKFNKNRYTNEISAGMGMFQSCFITDSKELELRNKVKLVNDKWSTKATQENIGEIFGDYPEFQVTLLPDTKKVAGYICNKALIIFTKVQYPDFYIYYTKDIRLENPNWSVPYNMIDGVMLEYAMERYGILMKFTAKEVRPDDIDNDEFKVDTEEYKPVPPAAMKEKMDEIFGSFF